MKLAIGNPGVGDPILGFELPASNGDHVHSRSLEGRWAVVTFFPSEQVPACAGVLDALRDAHEQLASRGARVLGITLTPTEKLRVFADEHRIPFALLSDTQLQVSSAHGALRPKDGQVPAEPTDKLQLNATRRTLLLAPNMRIARVYDNPKPEEHVPQLLADLETLIERDPPRKIVAHAPVLLVPNVLPPELCQRLVEVWNQENVDSGFMRQVGDKTVGMYDYSHKIRRDHFMKPSPELDALKKLIGSRVVTAMKTAFNYEVTRFEDFRIASYDASRGGYFRPHRDNTTDGPAHRRFAMSLLLNDDYDGGSLRFPEYGLHEYRPDVGGAVVFSCSLLHEATDVTRGNRFVLLSFFYGEKEAKIREEYNKRTGGEYRASQKT